MPSSPNSSSASYAKAMRSRGSDRRRYTALEQDERSSHDHVSCKRTGSEVPAAASTQHGYGPDKLAKSKGYGARTRPPTLTSQPVSCCGCLRALGRTTSSHRRTGYVSDQTERHALMWHARHDCDGCGALLAVREGGEIRKSSYRGLRRLSAIVQAFGRARHLSTSHRMRIRTKCL